MKLPDASSVIVRSEASNDHHAHIPAGTDDRASEKVRRAEKKLIARLLKTQREIRRVDFCTALCVMITLALAILFVGILFDSWLLSRGLSVRGRLGFASFWVAASFLSFIWKLIPVLRRRVNPLYAAKILEETQQDPHNLTINWLQLCRKAGLDATETEEVVSDESAAIRRAVLENVTLQAARQSENAPVETTVDCSSLIRWGIALASLVSILAVYVVLSPKSPFVSASRIVAPFAEIERPQALRFEEVVPGDATVFQGDYLDVEASIPGARTWQNVEILWSTEDGRLVDVSIPMESTGPSRFSGRLPDDEEGLAGNLSYRVVAGRGGQFESSSDVYHVEVKPQPSFRVEKTTLRFPGYTGLASQTFESQGDVRAVENTTVEITARANEKLDRAYLLPDGNPSRAVAMTISADEPDLATISFPLLWSDADAQERKPEFSTYVLLSEDVNGEKNRDAQVYTVSILPDLPPTIRWNMEESERVEVPVNDVLRVRFIAEDPDYSLRRVQLNLAFDAVGQGNQSDQKRDPKPIDLPLTSGKKSAVKPDGPTPFIGEQSLTYPLVPQKLGLNVGDELEYWGVAFDSKHPDANVGMTEKRVLVVVAPVANPGNPNEPDEDSQPQEQGAENNSGSGSSGGSSASEQEGEGQKSDGENSDGEKSGDQGSASDSQPETSGESGDESESSASDGAGESGSESGESSSDAEDAGEQNSGASNAGGMAGASQGEDSGDEESSGNADGANQDGSESTDESEGANGAGESQNDGSDSSEETTGGPGDESGDAQSSGASSQGNEEDGEAAQDAFQKILDFMKSQQSGEEGDANGNENGEGTSQGEDESDARQGAGKSSGTNGSRKPSDTDDQGESTESEDEVEPDFQSDADIPTPEEKRKLPTRTSAGKPEEDSPSYQADNPDKVDPNTRRRQGEVDPDSNDFLGQNADPNATEPSSPKRNDANITLDPLDQGNGTAADSVNKDAPEAKGGSVPPSGGASEIDEDASDDPTRPNGTDEREDQSGQSPTDAGGASGGSGSGDDRSDAQSDGGEGSRSPNKKDPSKKSDGRPSSGDSDENGVAHGGGGAGAGLGEIEQHGEQLAPADAPRLQYTEQATNLALEYLEDSLKGKVDKRLLKELGWTEEELRDFVEHWQKLREEAREGDGKGRDDYLKALERLGLGDYAQPAESGAADATRERDPNASLSRSGAREASRVKTPDRLTERVRAFTRGAARGSSGE